MIRNGRVGVAAAAALAALVLLAGCSSKPEASNNGSPPVVDLGGTPQPTASGGVTSETLGSPSSGSTAGTKGTAGTPKPGSTSKAKPGATPGSTAGTTGGSTGQNGNVTYNKGSGTFTITYPTPGSTYSFPGQIGSTTGPQPTTGTNPSPAPVCTLPAAPTANGVGVTAVHLDSVDSGNNAHGPQTTFAASSVHSILAVATLAPSVNVTGTVITYAQILCSNVESTQDLTLSGPTTSGQLFIRFDTPAGQNFPTGKYRLIFYVNPSASNSVPSQYIDYVIN